jgi:uncharacterized repeat protein (TIGR03803 family)
MNPNNNVKKSGLVLFLLAAAAISAQSQTYQVVLDFNRQNGGETEYVTPTQGADGYIYGTSSGVAFRGLPPGRFTAITLCTQPSCNGGGNDPWGGVILATDGNFYGTTGDGGAYGQGAVFRLTPNGTLTTIHSFCAKTNCPDGFLPEAGLTEGTDGNLYGTTALGGLAGYGGTVFKIDTSGQLTTLYSFCQQTNCADGDVPHGTLLQASDGNFYGITSGGGNGNFDGIAYRISPSGAFSIVYKFCSEGGTRCTDGNYPFGGLIQATDGNLYGTTSSGGANAEGTVFKLTLDGTETPLYSFCSQTRCADGSTPYGSLVQGNDGNFYGTTTEGGANGQGGTIFELTPGGAETTLYSFCSESKCNDGSTPFGGLLQKTDGTFYGITYTGGVHGVGVGFNLSTGLGPFVAFVQSAGQVGQTAQILGQALTGTTAVSFNGLAASFTVKSDTFLTATVPPGATTGYVTVTTPSGVLTSNVPFRVIQ